MPTKLPSTRVRTLPGRTGAHAWRTALFSSATVERCVYVCVCVCVCVCVWGGGGGGGGGGGLVQKGCRVTCCMGRGIVLDVHKVTSKHPRRLWQHLIPQDLDVPMPVHGSIHHDQLTPPPMVDCTPYHEPGLIIIDTVSPLSAVLHSAPPPPLAAASPCSKVSLGHLAGRRDQYPPANSRLRMVRNDIRLPNRRIICISRRGAVMKRFVLTIRIS